MITRRLYILFICFSSFVFSQQNTLLLNTYYKDQLFHSNRNKTYSGTDFLPILESQFDLNNVIRDSSVQYYDFTETLFKKHLIEVKGDNFNFSISPVVDLTLGKDIADTNQRKLFQNTRGFFIEGDLLKNFSFSTSFFENQSRNPVYQSEYYRQMGEIYTNSSDTNFTVQNAVIPGGGRTKPFKVDGFDYAYATGNIVFSPKKWVSIIAGNTPQFIGHGYRSIFFSDNSAPSSVIRAQFNLSDRWTYNLSRGRLMNLVRKPISSTVESYYEAKNSSIHYLSYQANEKFGISLFEGILWSRHDSLQPKSVDPLYYNPLPLLSSFIASEENAYGILGLDLHYQLAAGHGLYGQFGIGNTDTKQLAYQFGYRAYDLFKIKNLFVQVEYNSVSGKMYVSKNRSLSYSNYNLPLAHPKGNGFTEIVFRTNYEVKRVYVDLLCSYYDLNGFNPTSILAKSNQTGKISGSVFNQQVEFGYRFNRKMNFSVFASWLFRTDSTQERKITNALYVGLKTAIFNRYTDF